MSLEADFGVPQGPPVAIIASGAGTSSAGLPIQRRAEPDPAAAPRPRRTVRKRKAKAGFLDYLSRGAGTVVSPAKPAVASPRGSKAEGGSSVSRGAVALAEAAAAGAAEGSDPFEGLSSSEEQEQGSAAKRAKTDPLAAVVVSSGSPVDSPPRATEAAAVEPARTIPTIASPPGGQTPRRPAIRIRRRSAK